jgi:hypothetical protein
MTLEFWRRALRPSPIRNHLIAVALIFALAILGIVWGLFRLWEGK